MSAASDFAQKASLSSFVQSPFSARLRERAIAFSAPAIARRTATGTRGWPKSAAALKSYLDKQVKEGVITPAERKALGR